MQSTRKTSTSTSTSTVPTTVSTTAPTTTAPTVNKTSVNDNIPDIFDGTLSLTICDAELKGEAAKDPYCKISLGSSKLTQRLKEGESWGKERYTTVSNPQSGNHPVWNESHDFSIRKMKQDSHLKIKVFDRETLKDDYLGLAKVDLSELVQNLGNGEKQYYQLLNKDNFSIGRVGIITKFTGLDLPIQQVKKVDQPTTDQSIEGKNIPGGVPDHIQGKDEFQGPTHKRTDAITSGAAAATAGVTAGAIASDLSSTHHSTHHSTHQKDVPITDRAITDRAITDQVPLSSSTDEQIAPSDFLTTKDKVPEDAALLQKEDSSLALPETSATTATTDNKSVLEGDRFEVQPGVIQDEIRDTSASTSASTTAAAMLEKGKAKLGETAELAKHTYKQTMPEALGGGYPVKSAIIKDEDGSIISHPQPTMLEKGKEKLNLAKDVATEVYRENMPEAIGGRATTLSGQPSDSESLIDRAKHTYKQTMPEALGGGYPVKSAIIKDEDGSIISHPQPTMLEKGKEKLNLAKDVATEVYRENMPEAIGGRATTLSGQPSESLIDRAKHTYKQTMPEALGGGYPVKTGIIQDEEGKIISEAHQPTRVASERLLDVRPVNQPVDTESVVIAEQTTTQGPTLINQAKAVYKEIAPEALGGRAPTLLEKVQQGYKPGTTEEDTTLIGKVKALAAETLPESLGGRPPTLGERLKAETTIMGKAKVLKEETLPEALGGRPTTWHEQKGTPQPIRAGDSLLATVKKVYTETAPEALGGRPATVTEKVEEVTQPSLIERTEEIETQPSTQPSLFERVKQTITAIPQTITAIPQILGVKSTTEEEAINPVVADEHLLVVEREREREGQIVTDNMPEVKDVQKAKSQINEEIRQKVDQEPVSSIQKIEYVQKVEIPIPVVVVDNYQLGDKSPIHQTVVSQTETTLDH